MSAPRWVLRAVVDAMHDRQLAEHGGAAGLRDEGLLESALARAQHLHAYGETDLCALAAAYAGGICRNLPFVDGNKRAAFLTAYVFLRINGRTLVASEAEAVEMVTAMAAGELADQAFADWLRRNLNPSDR
ncbi:MAG: type II toxin-antitoxin system death-on-curing family toxin [Alphaproteobacteria bacterium]|nr:type II toxin-antitoxin system death-on-curing family toxin [Alphaproteobacteria bacterium]